jgi:hypothetical protein
MAGLRAVLLVLTFLSGIRAARQARLGRCSHRLGRPSQWRRTASAALWANSRLARPMVHSPIRDPDICGLRRCRFVVAYPGCAATATRSVPAASARRCSSNMNSRLASLLAHRRATSGSPGCHRGCRSRSAPSGEHHWRRSRPVGTLRRAVAQGAGRSARSGRGGLFRIATRTRRPCAGTALPSLLRC